MKGGGCLLTMTYYGAEKVVEHYNIMGPIKAALECVVHYLAAELGSKGIRVHAISPGPIKTGAGSGIEHFEELLTQASHRAPMRRAITIEDVGNVAVYLVSDAAAALTGHIVYADAGYHVFWDKPDTVIKSIGLGELPKSTVDPRSVRVQKPMKG